MRLMAEQWLPVVDYEGLYQVSDQGRVMSVKRRILMRPQPDRGYLYVTLSKGGKPKRFGIHQLVLRAFDGECPPGHESRHLNGIRSDNRRENLRWATHLVNIRDKRQHANPAAPPPHQCPAGHEYTPENTYEFTRKDGRHERHCRKCRRDRWHAKHGKTTRRNKTRYSQPSTHED